MKQTNHTFSQVAFSWLMLLGLVFGFQPITLATSTGGTKSKGSKAKASTPSKKSSASKPSTSTKAGARAKKSPAKPAGRSSKAASKTAPSKSKPASASSNRASKSKTRPTSSRAGKKAVASKSTVSRKNSRAARIAARREAERRAAAARLARIRAVDNGLLASTQNQIESDDLTGENLHIRQLALEALGDNPGTVVVMDANSGRVLSMVNQAWAVSRPFKPCSTIKLLTSLAALREGIADPDTPLAFGRTQFTMTQALARSNNEYFQDLGEQIGLERMLAYAREAGFGQPTEVNVPGESNGYLPTSANNLRRVFSHGDGFGITAVQLAAFTAAIANGGTVYKPQILRTQDDLKNFKPEVASTISIPEPVRAKLIEGMLAAVDHGTARRSNAATLAVAGKTGSCDCYCAQGTKLGLFTSFINPADPSLVISVITTGSRQRGSLASIVAGNIYNGLAETGGLTATPRSAPLRVGRDAKGNLMLTNQPK
ncbi:MAG: hypothetical protein HY774_26555 [Acidobacteria bacterium]|nr:hypothetical protein [Acidobacteriota bacterium]